MNTEDARMHRPGTWSVPNPPFSFLFLCYFPPSLLSFSSLWRSHLHQRPCRPVPSEGHCYNINEMLLVPQLCWHLFHHFWGIVDINLLRIDLLVYILFSLFRIGKISCGFHWQKQSFTGSLENTFIRISPFSIVPPEWYAVHITYRVNVKKKVFESIVVLESERASVEVIVQTWAAGHDGLNRDTIEYDP